VHSGALSLRLAARGHLDGLVKGAADEEAGVDRVPGDAGHGERVARAPAVQLEHRAVLRHAARVGARRHLRRGAPPPARSASCTLG